MMRATVPSCWWTPQMSALFGFLLLAGRIAVSEQSFSTATLCDVTNAVGTTGSWAGNSLYEVFVFDCADGTFLSRVDVWGAIWISNLQWTCSDGGESDMYPVDEYLPATATASFSVAISALESTADITGDVLHHMQQLYIKGYDIDDTGGSSNTTTWIGPIGEGNGDGDLYYTTGTYCEDGSLATGAVMWANDETSFIYAIMLRCARITSTCVSPGNDSGVSGGGSDDNSAVPAPAVASDNGDVLPWSSSSFRGETRPPVAIPPYEAPPTTTTSHIKGDSGEYAEVGGLAGVICLSIAAACICGMLSTCGYLDWKNIQSERRGERGFYPQDLRLLGGRGRGSGGNNGGSANVPTQTAEGAHISPPPPPQPKPSEPQAEWKAQPGTPVAIEASGVEGSTPYVAAQVVGASPSAPPLPETIGVVVSKHPPL